jgi:hypothetical protein
MTAAPTPLHRRHLPHRHQLVWIVGVAVFVLAAIGAALLIQGGVFEDSSSSPKIVQGSGIAATQARELPGFSSVDLAGSNNVTIQVGPKQSVLVRADDNLLRLVTTQVHAGTLVIGNTGNFTAKSPMSVEITVPSLETLTLSGSGTLAADDVQMQRLTVTLSGSGVVRASGTATRLDVSVDGSGDVQLGRLVARDVHAVVNTSGRIVVNATNSLDASVRGSGAILYRGNPPHVTKSVTGNGAITRT